MGAKDKTRDRARIVIAQVLALPLVTALVLFLGQVDLHGHTALRDAITRVVIDGLRLTEFLVIVGVSFFSAVFLAWLARRAELTVARGGVEYRHRGLVRFVPFEDLGDVRMTSSWGRPTIHLIDRDGEPLTSAIVAHPQHVVSEILDGVARARSAAPPPHLARSGRALEAWIASLDAIAATLGTGYRGHDATPALQTLVEDERADTEARAAAAYVLARRKATRGFVGQRIDEMTPPLVVLMAARGGARVPPDVLRMAQAIAPDDVLPRVAAPARVAARTRVAIEASAPPAEDDVAVVEPAAAARGA